MNRMYTGLYQSETTLERSERLERRNPLNYFRQSVHNNSKSNKNEKGRRESRRIQIEIQ